MKKITGSTYDFNFGMEFNIEIRCKIGGMRGHKLNANIWRPIWVQISQPWVQIKNNIRW